MDKCFVTGWFAFDEYNGCVWTSQRFHDDGSFNHVINSIYEDYIHKEYDGYVTNIGNNVTIHMKKEQMTERNIDMIETYFFLKDNDELIINVVPLTDDELKKPILKPGL